MSRPFISLSGLDLSFLNAPAGNVHPSPPKRRKRKAKRKTAEVINLAEVRKARRLHLKARDKKVIASKVHVGPGASKKVKALAKQLGIKTAKPRKAKKRRLH